MNVNKYNKTNQYSKIRNTLQNSKKVIITKREFSIVIEQDEDGVYIASVPELPGCHTQANTLDELNKRIVEAIELYLEVNKSQLEQINKFIGFQKVEVTFE